MAYMALYRQWRPQDFDNLVGQEHISTTLRNALVTGRIAHAYLFAGPRGTGKTSTAKILAKALNCVHGPTPKPCNECPNCKRINSGSSMDVSEADAASNRGIDEIRDLRETVKFAPVDGRYKVYIIDEVHMLTTEAFNALLKTLEEPPSHVVFILATTEAHKIPATIHSRCQRYDFRRISVGEIEERLTKVVRETGLNVAPEALKLIAVHADGGMRDALSILDQCSTFDSEAITAEQVRQMLGLIGHEWVWRLTGQIALRDAKESLLTLDELMSLGKDVRQIMAEVALCARGLMLYKAAPEIDSFSGYSDRDILDKHSKLFTHDELVSLIQQFGEAGREARWAVEPRVTAEMAILAACRRESSVNMEALAARVAALEEQLALVSKGELRVSQPMAVNSQGADARSKAAVSPTRETPQTQVKAKPQAAESQVKVDSSKPITDIKGVWDKILAKLLADGKRTVYACVSQGRLANLTDKAATIQFTAAFPKERTEKDDFRAIVEEAIAEVSGQVVRLTCVMGGAEPIKSASRQPVNKQEAKSNAATSAPDTGENHPAVRQALAMFGGKVHPEEKNTK